MTASPAAVAPSLPAALLARVATPPLPGVRFRKTALPVRAVLARAPHRADKGMEIEMDGKQYLVTDSHQDNPNIKIQDKQTSRVRSIPWASSDYWIVRKNEGGDHDMRWREGVADNEVDTRVTAAKGKALEMIKAYVKPHIKQADHRGLADVALGNFVATKTAQPSAVEGDLTTGDAEWKYTWYEGGQARPKRTWTFTVDIDNPLSTSHQEPHVGWEVQAVLGTSREAVDRKLGHIWLNRVRHYRG